MARSQKKTQQIKKSKFKKDKKVRNKLNPKMVITTPHKVVEIPVVSPINKSPVQTTFGKLVDEMGWSRDLCNLPNIPIMLV